MPMLSNRNTGWRLTALTLIIAIQESHLVAQLATAAPGISLDSYQKEASSGNGWQASDRYPEYMQDKISPDIRARNGPISWRQDPDVNEEFPPDYMPDLEDSYHSRGFGDSRTARVRVDDGVDRNEGLLQELEKNPGAGGRTDLGAMSDPEQDTSYREEYGASGSGLDLIPEFPFTTTLPDIRHVNQSNLMKVTVPEATTEPPTTRAPQRIGDGPLPWLDPFRNLSIHSWSPLVYTRRFNQSFLDSMLKTGPEATTEPPTTRAPRRILNIPPFLLKGLDKGHLNYTKVFSDIIRAQAIAAHAPEETTERQTTRAPPRIGDGASRSIWTKSLENPSLAKPAITFEQAKAFSDLIRAHAPKKTTETRAPRPSGDGPKIDDQPTIKDAPEYKSRSSIFSYFGQQYTAPQQTYNVVNETWKPPEPYYKKYKSTSSGKDTSKWYKIDNVNRDKAWELGPSPPQEPYTEQRWDEKSRTDQWIRHVNGTEYMIVAPQPTTKSPSIERFEKRYMPVLNRYLLQSGDDIEECLLKIMKYKALVRRLKMKVRRALRKKGQ